MAGPRRVHAPNHGWTQDDATGSSRDCDWDGDCIYDREPSLEEVAKEAAATQDDSAYEPLPDHYLCLPYGPCRGGSLKKFMGIFGFVLLVSLLVAMAKWRGAHVEKSLVKFLTRAVTERSFDRKRAGAESGV
jgi:hypothetical protein